MKINSLLNEGSAKKSSLSSSSSSQTLAISFALFSLSVVGGGTALSIGELNEKPRLFERSLLPTSANISTSSSSYWNRNYTYFIKTINQNSFKISLKDNVLIW